MTIQMMTAPNYKAAIILGLKDTIHKYWDPDNTHVRRDVMLLLSVAIAGPDDTPISVQERALLWTETVWLWIDCNRKYKLWLQSLSPNDFAKYDDDILERPIIDYPEQDRFDMERKRCYETKLEIERLMEPFLENKLMRDLISFAHLQVD